ncbi:MAG: ABC transporter substrate-binding protein, partial [Deltaproteobacteria bacterium]|nr:ABC transporter substrate-binding protein [Deltaproteobacteria bacterium]
NQTMRSNLVEINYKGAPVPELAESCEASHGAAKWVFKLRRGVEFHNGKTMDAEDVVYSFNEHRGPDTKSAAKGVAKPIKDIKADGKYTVIITLEEGNADFPFIASDYHIPIVPTGTKGKEYEKGVGTGPFIMEAWEPGVRFFAKRNPNYFKSGRPYFDEIEVIGISDTNARTNALKTGQIDVMNRCEPKTLHLLERSPGVQVLKLEGARHYTIPMLTTIKPYDNNDVRLGLKYAIDREQMVKTILRGYGYVGNDHPIPRNNQYHAAELPQRKYDPDKARFHLKKAGELDRTFKLHAADAAFPGAVDAAVLLKESASRAGINIQVVREPDDGYWESVWIKKEWVMCYWSGRATADWMFSIAYTADASWNDAKWKHPKFNQLIKAARAELDQKKRREMYVECQRIVRDEGATPCPAFALQLSAATKKLAFKNPAANWEFDGMRIAERWWFA